MDYPKIPLDELVRRLELPGGVLDMVLDTDTYNEVDDQFALCYALLSPERLNVKAVYAAPFFNDRSVGPEDGMEKSYDEIVRLLGTMNRSEKDFVYRGSRAYLPDDNTPVESEAARDLVKKALAQPEGRQLYVAAIGAITNVASAILMEPKIVDKITVVWLGGNPLYWHTAREFNLMQDVPAARVVLNCGCPVVLIPCMGVTSHLTTTVQEMSACIGGKNAMCDALLELFSAYSPDHFAWAKEIWDVSAIAYLLNEKWTPSTLEPSPVLSDNCSWSVDKRRHPIRVVDMVHRNPIFKDLYRKLANA